MPPRVAGARRALRQLGTLNRPLTLGYGVQGPISRTAKLAEAPRPSGFPSVRACARACALHGCGSCTSQEGDCRW